MVIFRDWRSGGRGISGPVTNPMIAYRPRLGDRLIGDDQKLYQVVSIKNEGTLLELRSTKDPITIYVSTQDVYTNFHAVLGREIE